MKFILFILLAFLLTSPVYGEEKIVFDDYEKVYFAVSGFESCQSENFTMQQMIENLNNQLVIADKQIEILKKTDSICNAYNKEIGLTIEQLKDIVVDNKEVVNRLKEISNPSLSQRLKDSLGSIGIGFMLGVLTILIF